MDDRVVAFIRGLRSAGVRVSVAESGDALAAVETLDPTRREWFKSALRSSLVKERDDQPTFERLFPVYFSPQPPPPTPWQEWLSEADQQRLEEALGELGLELDDLLKMLLEGRGFEEEELARALEQAGLARARADRDLGRVVGQARRSLGLDELAHLLEALVEALRSAGLDPRVLERLAEGLRSNLERMEADLRMVAVRGMAEHRARHPRTESTGEDLAERPFPSLSEHELDLLRREATRLASRLRTRVSLRQKRGEGHLLDAKATLRTNLVHAGVPFEIVPRTRRRKAKFTLLCDVSTSMRPVVSFLLYLLFQIQDQVARTRCFAYVDRLVDVSSEFDEHLPNEAVAHVLRRVRPGHYNTDLGASLETLLSLHADAFDRRTTIVICGDARNNFRPARADLIDQLSRRAHRIIWFNPEAPRLWGTEDSDMLLYAPRVSAVRQVSNLRQLAEAVDRLFPGSG